MKSIVFIFTAFFAVSTSCCAQRAKTYNWSWKTDGAILAGSMAGYAGSQSLKSQAQQATYEDIINLDGNRVWGFDRGAIKNYSYSAASLSDLFLYGSLSVPLIAHFDKGVKNEKGAVLGMMFESLLINQSITNSLKATTHRYRPYTYNTALSEDITVNPTAKQSFISGHTSSVATATFFTAKVLTDLHPESKLKPLIWASAIVIPATTGYLRYRAGKHFPSDIIAGYGVGALVGFFVPHFHKIKIKNRDVNLDLGSVSGGGLGFSFSLVLD